MPTPVPTLVPTPEPTPVPTIFELLVANVAFGTTETSFQPYGLSGEPGQGDNWENYCGDSYVAHVKCTSTSTLDGASEEFEVEGRPSAMPTGLPSSEPTPVPSYVGIRVAYPDGRDLECSSTVTIGWYMQSTPDDDDCNSVDIELWRNDSSGEISTIARGYQATSSDEMNTYSWTA